MMSYICFGNTRACPDFRVCNASPFSLVAEHLACNQKVASSILAAGYLPVLRLLMYMYHTHEHLKNVYVDLTHRSIMAHLGMALTRRHPFFAKKIRALMAAQARIVKDIVLPRMQLQSCVRN